MIFWSRPTAPRADVRVHGRRGQRPRRSIVDAPPAPASRRRAASRTRFDWRRRHDLRGAGRHHRARHHYDTAGKHTITRRPSRTRAGTRTRPRRRRQVKSMRRPRLDHAACRSLGALLVHAAPPRRRVAPPRPRPAFTALVTFLVSLLICSRTSTAQAGFQLVVDRRGSPPLGIHFHLGVDGISLWLVLLTTFLMPLDAARRPRRSIDKHACASSSSRMLVLEAGMLGAFVALDLFVFYVFWEVMLIPMYFIIGIWGGERRLYASIKFVIYTMVGSLLMLVAILYVYVQHARASPARCTLRLRAAARSWRCRTHAQLLLLRARSRWRSRSRCRCSRSTPGCPTRTSRRRPAAR